MAVFRAVVVGLAVAAVAAGCAAQGPAPGQATTSMRAAGTGGAAPRSRTPRAAPASQERTYVDHDLGFAISRPSADWKITTTSDDTEEGLTIPVVMRDSQSGAQVVLQVAPAVATPGQFAERLTTGLRAHPGFSSTDPEPLPISDGAVGFRFAMEDKVEGRVAVLEGGVGQMFMMMATWPSSAPRAVRDSVDAIFGSLRPVPRGPGRGGAALPQTRL